MKDRKTRIIEIAGKRFCHLAEGVQKKVKALKVKQKLVDEAVAWARRK